MDKMESMVIYDNIIEQLERWIHAVASKKDAGPTEGEPDSLRGIHLVRLSNLIGSLEDASTALRKGYKDFHDFL